MNAQEKYKILSRRNRIIERQLKAASTPRALSQVKWGHKMEFLKNIHTEIEPKRAAFRHAWT